MKRVAVALLVLALAACSPRDSGTLGPAPTAPPAGSPSGGPSSASPPPTVDSSPPPGQSATTTRPPAGTITISLWYTRGGRLAFTRHTRPTTVATSRLALTELAAGPSAPEAAAGLSTAFPAGTAFTIAGISGGVATVSFNAAFYAGGRAAARLRQAQGV
jgi:spore germination protein GerM